MFAPDYPRVEGTDIIKFPKDDSSQRKAIFIAELMRHPAKANLHMLAEIIAWVSQPGETILDIMAGVGSILIAALTGRKIICIEIEPPFAAKIEQQREHIITNLKPDADIFVINGDCLKILPLPADHIIFSPPYAGIMKKKKFTAGDISADMIGEELLDYSATRGNVGQLNRFMYNQTMEKIYKKCFDSIRPGGTMTVIIKDYIENQKRVYLSDWVIRTCIRIGFEQKDWFKWEALGGGFPALYRSMGLETVDDEDIMVFVKPYKSFEEVTIKEAVLCHA